MSTLDLLSADLVSAREEIARLQSELEGAYRERDMCVVLIAKLARAKGARVGIGKHEEFSSDTAPVSKEWRNVIYIDLPMGQVSWHFREDERHLFSDFPRYTGQYDGHTTEEKYRRVLNPFPGQKLQMTFDFEHHRY